MYTFTGDKGLKRGVNAPKIGVPKNYLGFWWFRPFLHLNTVSISQMSDKEHNGTDYYPPPPPIPLQKSQSSFILVLIDQLGEYIARLYLVQVNKVNTISCVREDV